MKKPFKKLQRLEKHFENWAKKYAYGSSEEEIDFLRDNYLLYYKQIGELYTYHYGSLLGKINEIIAKNDFVDPKNVPTELEYNIIKKENNELVIAPFTFKAVKYFAKNCNWCVCHREIYGDKYKNEENDGLVIIRNDINRKFGIHVKINNYIQFYDQDCFTISYLFDNSSYYIDDASIKTERLLHNNTISLAEIHEMIKESLPYFESVFKQKINFQPA